MKILKNTLTILFAITISINSFAQEAVKESEEKKSSWDAILEESNDDYESIVKGKCISRNCENGFGKTETFSGGTYEGNFKNGLRNGKGTEMKNYSHFSVAILKTAATIKYVGAWKAGLKNGHGEEFIYDEKGTVISKYIGEWSDDKKNGEGKLYASNRLLYEGNFKNGYRDKLSGCITGDCENGYGVFIYPNKGKYIGEFKNGLKDGFGSETDPNGMYLYGNWKNDKEEGYIRIFDKNNELMFAVEMKSGKPLKSLDKNDVEVGCIIGDCVNGFGHYVWDDNLKYIGEFNNEQLHGLGTLTWPDGKFVGNFIDGKRHGYGIQYDTNGEITLEAQYTEGSYYPDSKIILDEGKCVFGNCVNGFGVLIVEAEKKSGWETGYKEFKNDFELKYQGMWKSGKQIGVGFIEDRNGNTYVGQFDYGDYEGKGVANFVNGDVYNGDFGDARMTGNGTMIYADGSKYIGEWDGNEKHGEGKEYDSNGKLIYSGDYWKNERDE